MEKQTDYVISNGHFDLLTFFNDHIKILFPNLFILIEREASRRVVEVGCKRFFSKSSYISSPKRANLDVLIYKRIALLSTILYHVYVSSMRIADE
jgi:hypothetical protein